ncbi:MAG: radical SAM protein, partial [Actinomycetota bacterium]|nr:radical SAM protein [Actinomycetota bacterium]
MYMTRYKVVHRLDERSSVLVNTLSGAIDVIENRYLPLLKDTAALADQPDISTALRTRGYLFPSRAAEEAALQKLFADHNGSPRPTAFVICPTYACNLRCVYCFEGNLTTESTRVLSTEEVDQIFNAIGRLAPENATVLLFGGEPFLPKTKSIVEYILSSAAKRGLMVDAVTNGVNLADFLSQTAYRTSLREIQVTVDGPAAVHDIRRPKAGGQGSFTDIVNSIDRALALNLRIRMRVNIDRQNIGRLVELADFIALKGWHEKENFVALLAPVEDHTGLELEYRLSEDKLAAAWLKLKKRHPQLNIFQSRLFRNLDHIITVLDGERQTGPRFQYCESNYLGCYTFGTDGRIYLCAEAIGDQGTTVGTYYPEFVLDDER